ncbi:lytic murein transglycosylase B [Burkholderiales bacterium JOSHI_001]|nr:lytic murein transglycosylase B [Burkholderiales bacterium JOSHI_001]
MRRMPCRPLCRAVSACATLATLATLTLAAPDTAQAARAKRAAAVREDSAPDSVTYGRREDVQRFAQDVAERRGLPVDVVSAALAQARYLPTVARLIMPPRAGTAKNWAAYRARFLEPERVRAGLAFWRQHEAWLEQAQARFGVPASIVVGIIGVETFYGRVMGDFRVIDALATLSFDFPPGRKDKSGFFREELESLLVLALRDGQDPLSLRGSFAGAMGLPQFMPGSHLRYALDFDRDGRIDLARSGADAIGSVASYLAGHGWKRDMPTHYDVAVPVDAADRAALLGPDILPSFTPAQFAERGALLSPAGQQHEGSLALVELQNGSAAPSYYAGTENFYAVTRYNWSSYYAFAVIDLAAAVEAARRASGVTPAAQ